MRGVVIRILITGASGFLGQALISELEAEFDLTLTTRTDRSLGPRTVYLDLSSQENLAAIFDGIDAVIHTGALVHQMDHVKAPSRSEYFNINALARLSKGRQFCSNHYRSHILYL